MYCKCYNCLATVRIPDDKWISLCKKCNCVTFRPLEPGFKYIEKQCKNYRTVFKVEGDEIVHCFDCNNFYKAGNSVMFKRSGQFMYDCEEVCQMADIEEVQADIKTDCRRGYSISPQMTKSQAVYNGISILENGNNVCCYNCSSVNFVDVKDSIVECTNCKKTILGPVPPGFKYVEFTCLGKRDFYLVEDSTPFFRCKLCFETLCIGNTVVSYVCGQDVYNAESSYETVLRLQKENAELTKENQRLVNGDNQTDVMHQEYKRRMEIAEAIRKQKVLEQKAKNHDEMRDCSHARMGAAVDFEEDDWYPPVKAECENCSTIVGIETGDWCKRCECGALVINPDDPGRKYIEKLCHGIPTLFNVEEKEIIQCEHCSKWYTAGDKLMWTRCGYDVYNCKEVNLKHEGETENLKMIIKDQEQKIAKLRNEYADSAELAKCKLIIAKKCEEIGKKEMEQRYTEAIASLENEMNIARNLNKKINECNVLLLKKIQEQMSTASGCLQDTEGQYETRDDEVLFDSNEDNADSKSDAENEEFFL